MAKIERDDDGPFVFFKLLFLVKARVYGSIKTNKTEHPNTIESVHCSTPGRPLCEVVVLVALLSHK